MHGKRCRLMFLRVFVLLDRKFLFFKIDDDEGTKSQMIEQEVKAKILAGNFERILCSHEGEPDTEFERSGQPSARDDPQPLGCGVGRRFAGRTSNHRAPGRAHARI